MKYIIPYRMGLIGPAPYGDTGLDVIRTLHGYRIWSDNPADLWNGSGYTHTNGGQWVTMNYDLGGTSEIVLILGGQNVGNLYIDDVRFTTAFAAHAPEPSTWATLICGFGLVGYAMRRRSASQARTALAR